MNANEAWIAVFRRIPENMHDGLTVGLRSGVEIAIQTILKLEPDFIIMRGRLTGTQEGGKILMMPYAEMTVLSIVAPHEGYGSRGDFWKRRTAGADRTAASSFRNSRLAPGKS